MTSNARRRERREKEKMCTHVSIAQNATIISRKIYIMVGGSKMFEDKHDPLKRIDYPKVFEFVWIITLTVIIGLYVVAK